jgi:hypothetical protein
MDEDLNTLTREQLIREVIRLRNGIRAHRDSTGHDLCWHHPALWGLLPEQLMPAIAVPPWPRFLRGCVKYRESLDREAPNAPVADIEFGEES